MPTGPSIPGHPATARRPSHATEVETLLRSAARARGNRRTELLEQATLAGVPLARTLARRYRDRGVDRDDLDQIAFEYLVKAVRNYRPSPDSDFRSYALPTILGGIRRHFRDHAWAIKLPRRLQELQTRVNEVQTDLTAQLHRWPTLQEVADTMGVDVREVIEAEQARGCFRPTSLDSPLTDDSDHTLGHRIADQANTYELVDQVESLLRVVNKLPDRELLVLRRRFAEHRTQSEIGAELGVSQMQVSRMLRAVIARLQLALSVS